MEKITLNVRPRESFGKGPARALRRSGGVPGVIYRKGEARSIVLDHREMAQFIRKAAGEQVVVSLSFQDGGDKLALMKEYQSDPVRNSLLHVDFIEVSLAEKITLTVPVVTVGEPIGVKRDKGILQHISREVEIECLPDKIPGHIEIDISGLETARSVHVRDLTIGEGITVLTDPSAVIATVTPPIVEEAAPAAEAAAEEAAAPEVVKKGKKEEEGEEKKEG